MASRELSILVTAKNLASRVLGQVKGDVNGLSSTAKRASSNVGRNVGIATGAVAAGIAIQVKAGIDSLVELERVNNLTAAALESTGNAAGQSVEGIRSRAEEMERMSGVDDKVIQNAENLLLTFTNVGKKAFEPTLEAAVNLNAALGGGDEGLQGTLLQVAKAVNDPVAGMTALRRSGVSFTKEQIAQVKAMVAANDLMGAQAIVLGELETQFGGAAAAANKGILGDQKAFADAIEDMQMPLAKGFLPVIERVSAKMQELVADPQFIAGVEAFGDTLAGGFDQAIDFAESVDWGAVGSALSTMGSGAKMAMDAFLGAPAWLQTAILTGWGLNKVTGGALGSLVGMIGQGIIKGVMNMNAGVVNINAGTVTGGGPGGIPGAAGKGGGGALAGLGRGLATGAVLGGAAALTGIAAVEVVNFSNMRTEGMANVQSSLDTMPRRTGAEIDASIARIESVINEERPFLDQIIFNTNVKPQLDAELAELQALKEAEARDAASGRSTTEKAMREAANSTINEFRVGSNQRRTEANHITALAQRAASSDAAMLGTARTQTAAINATRSAQDRVKAAVDAERAATQRGFGATTGALSTSNARLSGILAKPTIFNNTVNVRPVLNLSLSNFAQASTSYQSSVRATTGTGFQAGV